jgi:hypothetical protein
MADWQQASLQGINPGLLQQSTVARNPRAAGLDALTSGLGPGINQAISNLIQSGQLKQIIAAMNGQQGQQQPASSGSMGNQPFPQGQGQATATQPPQPIGSPGQAMPNPFQQSMQKNTGMYNSQLSMGGNDPLGLFQ